MPLASPDNGGDRRCQVDQLRFLTLLNCETQRVFVSDCKLEVIIGYPFFHRSTVGHAAAHGDLDGRFDVTSAKIMQNQLNSCLSAPWSALDRSPTMNSEPRSTFLMGASLDRTDSVASGVRGKVETKWKQALDCGDEGRP